MLRHGGLFHPHGNGPQVEAAGHLDHGLDDRPGLFVLENVDDEGAVDLELVDPEVLQIRQARVAGAKVVDGQLDALGLPTGHRLLDDRLVLQQQGFRQFQLQKPRGQTAGGQGIQDLPHDLGAAELHRRQVDGDRQVP